MPEFQDLPQAQDPGQAYAPIEQNEIVLGGDYPDKALFQIVMQDVAKAEVYLQSKGLPAIWEDYDNLFRAYVPRRNWPQTDVPRANLGMPIITETIEDVLPQIFMAFFSEAQPFYLNPVGKTSSDAARAAAKVVCWAIKMAGFKEEVRKAMKSSLLYGFQVSKYGWRTCKQKQVIFERAQQEPSVPSGMGEATVPTIESDKVTKKVIETEIQVPTFENFSLRNVLLDPALKCQEAKQGNMVCFQIFTDANGLDEFRDNPAYKNIPSKEQLRATISAAKLQVKDSLKGIKMPVWREFQATADGQVTVSDPAEQPIEILECYYDDRIVTILDGCIVIRNEENEEGEIPALSNAFIDVPGSAYGFGIGFLLAGEQRFQQGVVNSWIDGLALSLNPAFQRIGSVNGGTQQIRLSPGLVRNEPAELKPLVVPSISGEALNAIQSSEARVSRRVGLDSTAVPTQALRTGTGVQSFQASIAGKLQYFVEIFADLVFIPALEKFWQMCQEHLTPTQIDAILSEQDGKSYKDMSSGGDIMDVYNGKYKFEVLTSTKLAARKAAAQLVPTLVQLFASAPVQDSMALQGKKVNYTELVQEMLDLSGYPTENIIVDMTDEDKQRLQQQQMGPQIMQQQAKSQDQNNKLEQIQAKGEATAGNTIVRGLLKNAENESALEKNIGPLLGGQAQ